MLQAFFADTDRNLIDGIHLLKAVMTDILIWKENEMGNFTIRSDYTVSSSLHGFPILKMCGIVASVVLYGLCYYEILVWRILLYFKLLLAGFF